LNPMKKPSPLQDLQGIFSILGYEANKHKLFLNINH
jgi:hypothetical protein